MRYDAIFSHRGKYIMSGRPEVVRAFVMDRFWWLKECVIIIGATREILTVSEYLEVSK